MLLFILLLLLSIHLKVAIRNLRKINAASHLSRRQKYWNQILVLLIPFFWSLLISSMLHPPSPGTHDPEMKLQRRASKAHFYESMAGVYGR